MVVSLEAAMGWDKAPAGISRPCSLCASAAAPDSADSGASEHRNRARARSTALSPNGSWTRLLRQRDGRRVAGIAILRDSASGSARAASGIRRDTMVVCGACRTRGHPWPVLRLNDAGGEECRENRGSVQGCWSLFRAVSNTCLSRSEF